MDAFRAKEYGNISDRMVQLLRETKPWARLVGAYSLVMTGLSFLLAVLCAYGAVVGDAPAAIMMSAVLFYVVLSLLSLFWGYFANQYASSIGSIETGRGRAIEAALSHQKNVWRMMGILAGLSALLVVGSIVLSVIFGVGAALSDLAQLPARPGGSARAPAGEPSGSPSSPWPAVISSRDDVFSQIEQRCNLPHSVFLCLVREDGSLEMVMGSEASFVDIERDDFRAFQVYPKDQQGEWVFYFNGPFGRALEPRLYKDARWEVARGEGLPGLKIAKNNHTCASASGRFRVLEIDGPRFVADFEQECPETGERLVGRVATDRQKEYR